MMRKKLLMLFVVGAALGTGACRESSPFAEGSGYGVGRARPTWIFGDEPAMKGEVMQGVTARTEAGIGRVPAPKQDQRTTQGRSVGDR